MRLDSEKSKDTMIQLMLKVRGSSSEKDRLQYKYPEAFLDLYDFPFVKKKKIPKN